MQQIIKNKFFHLAVLTVLLVAIFFFYNEKAPYAENHEGQLTIRVLDAEVLFKESKAFADIQNQIQVRAESLQKSTSESQEDLQSRHKNLEAQKNAFSESAYDEKMKALKDEFDTVNRETYKEKLMLDRAYKKSLKDVDDQFTAIVQNYANNNGITMIFNKAQTIFSADTLDITQEIKTLLDAKLPKYQIDFDSFKEDEATESK